jgi:hypothetical protein
MSAAPQSGENEAIAFLRRVMPTAGGFNLVAIDSTSNKIVAKAFTNDTIAQAQEWIARANRTDRFANVYWSVNPLKSWLNKKAEKEDVAALAWLHVDIDDTSGDVLERLRAHRPAPTCIIFSGGGYQAFWKLEEPVTVNGSAEALEDFNRYLEREFGADHCHNIDRIMRVPGTTNWPNAKKREKGRTPTQARLIEFHDERTYELADFTPLAKDSPSIEGKSDGIGKDRSADLMARVGRDVRAGLADYEILQKHRQHPHAREQTDPDRAVQRCLQKARKDQPARSSGETSDLRIVIRRGIDVARTLPTSEWLLRPFIERNAVACVYGDFGTFKTFVMIDWAMRIALGLPALGHKWPAAQADVLVVSAEGRGLSKRLRGWCKQNFPDEPFESVMERARIHCIEHPVNLSRPEVVLSLCAAIDALGIRPALIVIDTMNRNSDGTVERSTSDAATYLANVDQGLRSRYGAAVILTHHVGHAEKGRMRGPIVLAGNTDALIKIERPNPKLKTASITVERLKDSDLTAPVGIEANVIDLGLKDDQGEPVTTLAIAHSGEPVVTAAKFKAKGGNQEKVCAALAEFARRESRDLISSSEMLALMKCQGLKAAKRRTEVIKAFREAGLIQDATGGYRIDLASL